MAASTPVNPRRIIHFMQAELQVALDLFVAALVGLAVGMEREWSGHATGPDARFAGIRTFTIIGGLGGVAGWWMRVDYVPMAVALVAVLFAFSVVAYATAMRRPGTTSDGTTEIAAIAVTAIGVVSGLGYRAFAGGAAALVLLLLAEKSKMQRLLKQIDESEMLAAMHFAVLAFVILPFLPDASYGPYGAFRPRSLWIVVLMFSGLNFAGYIARRLVGETRGLGVTGLLGGFVSSTAVTLNFSRRSRIEPTLALPLALGVVAACTVLLPRVFVVATVLQPALSMPLLRFLLPPLAIGAALIAYTLYDEHRDGVRAREASMQSMASAASVTAETETTANARINRGLGNPLGLWSSIQMAIAFQVVLFLVAWLQESVGTTGVLATAAILGLTDVDALTVSMTRLAADPLQVNVAALAIAIGILANTALKSSLVIVLGQQQFRLRALLGLVLLAAGSGIGLWIGTH